MVIVAGFQGQSASAARRREITTLGRGGSDTTAVALAASLQAARCQIFTDVRGIFTADPRLVASARQLPVISYEEMLELAHQGAQVMQVRAVELGWVNGVVIEVLSSFEDAPGTLIKEDPFVEQRNKVRGLAHDRNVAKVTVVAVPDRPGVARAIFDPLAEAGINVDMIVQNVGHGGETDLSFTVPRVELAAAKKALDPLVRELGARELTTDASVAKVSIVGAGLHNAPGYAARMFGTLADTGVNIEMISTSEVRITCMIAEADLETALRALHDAFELERPEPIDATLPRSRAGDREPWTRCRWRLGTARTRAPRPDGLALTGFLARQERFAAGRLDQRRRPRLAGRGHAGGLPGPRRRADSPAVVERAGPGSRRPAGPCSCRWGSGRAGSRRIGPGGWRRSPRSRWPTPRRRSPDLADGAVRLKWPNDLVVEDEPVGTDSTVNGDPQAGRPPR